MQRMQAKGTLIFPSRLLIMMWSPSRLTKHALKLVARREGGPAFLLWRNPLLLSRRDSRAAISNITPIWPILAEPSRAFCLVTMAEFAAQTSSLEAVQQNINADHHGAVVEYGKLRSNSKKCLQTLYSSGSGSMSGSNRKSDASSHDTPDRAASMKDVTRERFSS